MANICDVTYKIVGDKSDIQEIFNKLQHASDKDYSRKYNGDWYDTALSTAIDEFDGVGSAKANNYACRGDIYWSGINKDGVLIIDMNTAWHEQSGLREVICKHYPDVSVYYCETECGCEIFHHNDISCELFGRYYLDACSHYFESCETFNTINEIREFIGKACEPLALKSQDWCSVEEINEGLKEFIDLHDPDGWICVHEFEIYD